MNTMYQDRLICLGQQAQNSLRSSLQGCHGQGKISGNEIFSRLGKSQGILWMARKISKELGKAGKSQFENKWLWQAVFRKFIYSVQEGIGCTFS